VIEQTNNSSVVLLLGCKLAVTLLAMGDFVKLAMGAIKDLVDISLRMTKRLLNLFEFSLGATTATAMLVVWGCDPDASASHFSTIDEGSMAPLVGVMTPGCGEARTVVSHGR
jgi:hypothetical protein